VDANHVCSGEERGRQGDRVTIETRDPRTDDASTGYVV